MYFMFCLVFLASVLQLTTNGQKVEVHDEHPFIGDDMKRVNDKFMLIPSVGYESADRPGKFTLFLTGWYYEAVEPSRRHGRREMKDIFEYSI